MAIADQLMAVSSRWAIRLERLHHQARVGLAAKVGGHHDGGAAEEGKGALRHAPLALRHEPGQAGGLLLPEELQRIHAGS